MKAIIDAKVIEMNKTEANAAGRFNTEEFKELSALRTAYPDFRIVIKTTKSKDNMKGLTVKYMLAFNVGGRRNTASCQHCSVRDMLSALMFFTMPVPPPATILTKRLVIWKACTSDSTGLN